MDYEKLIEMTMAGRSVNATAIALGLPQKTFEGYVKERSFPDCATAVVIANAAGVTLETAVKAIARRQVEVKTKSQKVKVALDKLAVSFNTLLHVANAGLKRIQPTV